MAPTPARRPRRVRRPQLVISKWRRHPEHRPRTAMRAASSSSTHPARSSRVKKPSRLAVDGAAAAAAAAAAAGMATVKPAAGRGNLPPPPPPRLPPRPSPPPLPMPASDHATGGGMRCGSCAADELGDRAGLLLLPARPPPPPCPPAPRRPNLLRRARPGGDRPSLLLPALLLLLLLVPLLLPLFLPLPGPSSGSGMCDRSSRCNKGQPATRLSTAVAVTRLTCANPTRSSITQRAAISSTLASVSRPQPESVNASRDGPCRSTTAITPSSPTRAQPATWSRRSSRQLSAIHERAAVVMPPHPPRSTSARLLAMLISVEPVRAARASARKPFPRTEAAGQPTARSRTRRLQCEVTDRSPWSETPRQYDTSSRSSRPQWSARACSVPSPTGPRSAGSKSSRRRSSYE